MAQKTRNTLKSYFEVGDIPSQQNYADVMDSFVSLVDQNSGSLRLTGSVELSGINGNITASQNISSSGDIYGASFEPNVVTTGYVSASATATTPTNAFGTEVLLDNDTILQGKNTSGTARNLSYIDSGNIVKLADANHSTILYGAAITAQAGSTITLDAATDVIIDAAGDDVLFQKNGTTTATINTDGGHISASGHITASGNISSSFISTGSLGSLMLTNLPIVDPLVTGSLWVSGSSTNEDGKIAGFVMVSGIWT